MDSDWEYTEVVFDGDAVESAACAYVAAGVSEIFSNELTLQLSLATCRPGPTTRTPTTPTATTCSISSASMEKRDERRRS